MLSDDPHRERRKMSTEEDSVNKQLPSSWSIGTLNLWHYPIGYRLRRERLARQIEAYIPQTMVFQEVWRWGPWSLFPEFLRQTGYWHFYQRTRNYLIMTDGLAVAHENAASEARTYRYSATFPWSPSPVPSRRFYVIADLPTSIGLVTVVNVHLTPFSAGDVVRRQEMQRLLDFIAHHRAEDPSRHLVLAGDFNMPLTSADRDRLSAFGMSQLGGQKWITYARTNPYADGVHDSALDHILYSHDTLNPVGGGLFFDREIVSDHYGVYGEFVKRVS
jgi:endonuclease/exonuclease/phosphatase (EEP) superfamily protein YafD